jgi:hypothetical protein
LKKLFHQNNKYIFTTHFTEYNQEDYMYTIVELCVVREGADPPPPTPQQAIKPFVFVPSSDPPILTENASQGLLPNSTMAYLRWVF